ncbi:hypothetical protein CDD81_2584 [Ophiocordyceps australis]|uniref:Uncharacterized protein n=1 Tax=Ophiocordyceps australis TaxID=1399860 RepID=A0A2C5XXE2_9HYPO|nr:hypothetical protein CDD81_2584 [Ophiocordyceps australis]
MKVLAAILFLATSLAASSSVLDKRAGGNPIPPPDGVPGVIPLPQEPVPLGGGARNNPEAELARLDQLNREAEQLQNQFRDEFRPGNQGGGGGQRNINPCAIL